MPFDEAWFDLGSIKLPRGTQILYVPGVIRLEQALDGNNWHYPNGCQPGFVSSGPTKDGYYFCRYWRFSDKEQVYVPDLRTKANSESTPGHRIIVRDSFNQLHVERELAHMDSKGDAYAKV